MFRNYNLEDEAEVLDLINKQRDLIQEQAMLISRQDAIIGSLACIMGDIQRHGSDKMHIGSLTKTIAYIEDNLREVQDV